jgi:hypothetical protein
MQKNVLTIIFSLVLATVLKRMLVLSSCKLKTVYNVFLMCQQRGLCSFSPRRRISPEIKVSKVESIKRIYHVFVITVCRKLKFTAWGKIPLYNIRKQVVKIGRLVQKVKKRNTQIDINTHTHTHTQTEQRNHMSTFPFKEEK